MTKFIRNLVTPSPVFSNRANKMASINVTKYIGLRYKTTREIIRDKLSVTLVFQIYVKLQNAYRIKECIDHDIFLFLVL